MELKRGGDEKEGCKLWEKRLRGETDVGIRAPWM